MYIQRGTPADRLDTRLRVVDEQHLAVRFNVSATSSQKLSKRSSGTCVSQNEKNTVSYLRSGSNVKMSATRSSTLPLSRSPTGSFDAATANVSAAASTATT